MSRIIDSLKNKTVWDSTNENYLAIWRQFNHFIIRYDKKPSTWEEHTSLFCAYLISEGLKSQTIKSYISAIKKILTIDGYEWNQNKVLFQSLTQACHLTNDTVMLHLPISGNLLELILFETQHYFHNQLYLEILYQAIFMMMYYGLMRIGEVVSGTHTLKARNVNIARNKDKIQIILYTSKTHGKESLPQKIVISSLAETPFTGRINYSTRFFCPFSVLRRYFHCRDGFDYDNEHFFVFKDRLQILPRHVRLTLRQILQLLGLDPLAYNTHSFRIGRSCDMFKSGVDLEYIKAVGRWRSIAVYKYLKQL